MSRPSGRAAHILRPLSFEVGVMPYAEGSCLVKCGNTHVLCSASLETNLPRWLKGQDKGWVTAEYGMLPRSTHSRSEREAARGKQSGRTQEIQRLIGRSLRSITKLEAMGETQITLDCDVIQADGGTRTAAISGAYVALHQAFKKLQKQGVIPAWPLMGMVAAVSVGIYNGQAVLDLDYAEDSAADTDANFIMTDALKMVELQATAEKDPFSEAQFAELLALAKQGITEITKKQKEALGIA